MTKLTQLKMLKQSLNFISFTKNNNKIPSVMMNVAADSITLAQLKQLVKDIPKKKVLDFTLLHII